MKVNIENQGDRPFRVILDHDNVNDFVLDPLASDVFEAEQGVIDLREFGEDEEGGMRAPEPERA